MDFRPEHLVYLACPVCHAGLKWTSPTITCTGCQRQYPIRDGLPVLIARPNEPAAAP